MMLVGGRTSYNQSNSDNRGRRNFKIILVGDSGVGKTCLIKRFCNRVIPRHSEATISPGVLFRYITIRGRPVQLQVWDTAGQERFFNALVSQFFRRADAVVAVYDVTRMETFRSIPGWLEECEYQGLNRDICRVLVGNKTDLVNSIQVNRNMAKQFAANRGMLLFEVSALSEDEGNMVDFIFFTLADKLVQQSTTTTPLSDSNSVIALHNTSSGDEDEERSSCWC